MPEDYLTARVDDYRRQYIEQNCNGDESQLADYVSTYYGKTVEEMEAYWNEGMEKSIRLEFIMDAIADELGVEVNQDDIDTYARTDTSLWRRCIISTVLEIPTMASAISQISTVMTRRWISCLRRRL